MSKDDEKIGIGRFELKIVGDHEIAYLKFPNYPRDRQLKTSRSFRLVDVIGKYSGPDIVFDFDQDGFFVGVEVLAD